MAVSRPNAVKTVLSRNQDFFRPWGLCQSNLKGEFRPRPSDCPSNRKTSPMSLLPRVANMCLIVKLSHRLSAGRKIKGYPPQTAFPLLCHNQIAPQCFGLIEGFVRSQNGVFYRSVLGVKLGNPKAGPNSDAVFVRGKGGSRQAIP